MANFSKDRLEKIRALMEITGVQPECPACKRGMLVLDRGQFGLQEVAQPSDHLTAATDTATPPGRTATCVVFACSSCGFVRMHSLTAVGL